MFVSVIKSISFAMWFINIIWYDDDDDKDI
jgi:hypothetical protein